MTWTIRLALVLLSAAGYFVLAVLGWGGLRHFFADPARMALAVVLLAMALASLFAAGNLSSGVREDRGNRWVLAAFGVLGLLDGFLPAYTDRFGFATIDGEVVRWIGVLVFAAGGVLRLWPVYVLGNRFSGLVAIQPGHTLVTSGIYGVIRHPSYLGALLIMLGWALAFRSAVGVLIALIIVVPLLARIRAEEALLSDQFGPEYDAYRARTWRLIPGVF
jgi:protein-S-isoprenylcysteine O-methyltransferase Ste14